MALFLLLTVFSQSLTRLSFYATASDEASFAISEANGKLKMAFEAVLEAEKAGANVSDLIGRLNEGGKLLAEAENAYKAADFSKAMSMAGECSKLAESVTSQASELRERAIVNVQMIFWHNLALSIFGAAALLVVLFFAWGWFKRAYVKRMLSMKPEVSGNVED
ncbi:MAG: hypothetical protein ACPLKQ_04520 [Candidatus Bathyarchaeales archaeon]